MRLPRRTPALGALVLVLVAGACSDDPLDAEQSPRLSKAEFCQRWDEMGRLQQDGDRLASAMELARMSLEAPAEVAEPVEQLYQLLEDRLDGREPDFDVMADASVEIMAYCGE